MKFGLRRAYLLYGLCGVGLGLVTLGEGLRTRPATRIDPSS